MPDDKESPSTVSHDPGHHQAPPQCLICMVSARIGHRLYCVIDVLSLQDVYSSPVVSVLCWHVFCQQCWLKALVGTKHVLHASTALLHHTPSHATVNAEAVPNMQDHHLPRRPQENISVTFYLASFPGHATFYHIPLVHQPSLPSTPPLVHHPSLLPLLTCTALNFTFALNVRNVCTAIQHILCLFSQCMHKQHPVQRVIQRRLLRHCLGKFYGKNRRVKSNTQRSCSVASQELWISYCNWLQHASQHLRLPVFMLSRDLPR